MTKKDVTGSGWQWFDESEKRHQYLGPKVALADTIGETTDDICKKILTCEATGKQYKIIPQELEFYRSMGLALPRRCHDCRHSERMQLRNPRKLWTRPCMKCSKEMQTAYQPSRPEIVYCEECYLKEVY